ncbi:MAG TPA: methyl-accepting chemotaxis protein [Spirochaetia bacterium]|nr:methyl-accepting chemotaxis protein [Spirochaetia bacterium]
MFKRAASIRTTIFVVVLGSIFLLVSVFSLLFGKSLSDSIKERGFLDVEQKVAVSAKEIDGIIKSHMELVSAYADIFMHDDFKTATACFFSSVKSRLAHDTEIYDIYFATAQGPNAGGYFGDATNWVPPEDYDWTKRSWFVLASAAIENDIPLPVIDEPYIDADTQKMVFTVARATTRNNTLLTVTAIDIFAETMNEIVSSLKPTESAKVYLIHKDGLYLTNENVAKLMEASFIKEYALDQYEKTILAHEPATFLFNGGKSYLVSVPLANAHWYLIAVGNSSDILIELIRKRGLIYGVPIISIILSIIIIGILINPSMKHIKQVAQGIADIARGGGDLTKTVSILSKDELGELAYNFNQFLLFMDALLLQINETSEKLKIIAENTNQETFNSSKTFEIVTKDLSNLEQQFHKQTEDLNRLVTTSKSFFEGFKELQEKLIDQAASVEETAAAMTQISKTMGNVAQLGKRGQDINEKLAEKVKSSTTTINELINVIGDIGKRSEAIASFAEVIAEIAERTNLLAMNAAIEAAHAGDAGKGFGVVADEIRKLAESSNEETNAIAETIQDISSTIEEGINLSRSVEVELSSMIEAVEQSKIVSVEISGATEEEAKGGEEILKALKTISDVNKIVKDTIASQTDDLHSIESTLQITQENNSAVITSLKQQITEINNLAELANMIQENMQTVKDEAEQLSAIMKRFKLSTKTEMLDTTEGV